MSKSRDTKESRERREYRRQQERDTFAKEAAERSAELEAMRKRTQELRELRLAQEKRGRVRENDNAVMWAIKMDGIILFLLGWRLGLEVWWL